MNNSHPSIVRNQDMVFIGKNWGSERWISNTPLYCGKKLVIDPMKSTSMHFHIKKTEHIYVQHGTLEIELIENKIRKVLYIEEGDAILITPGMIHRLTNPSKSTLILFEFSTQHFNNDSYRIE